MRGGEARPVSAGGKPALCTRDRFQTSAGVLQKKARQLPENRLGEGLGLMKRDCAPLCTTRLWGPNHPLAFK